MPGKSTLRLGAGHRIGVVARAAEEGLGDPAVPDPSGLVAEVVEVVRENGIDQVRFRVEQQRNALRVLGVESEVPRRGLFDPGGAQGKGSPFRRGPVHHPFLESLAHGKHGDWTVTPEVSPADCAGQVGLRVKLHVGHSGQSGLDVADVLLEHFRGNVRLDAERQLLPLLGRFHRLGRELGDVRNEGHLGRDDELRRSIENDARPRPPDLTRPAQSVGRKKVM